LGICTTDFSTADKADYADLVTFSPEDVSPWLDESIEFVRIIAELAESEMNLR